VRTRLARRKVKKAIDVSTCIDDQHFWSAIERLGMMRQSEKKQLGEMGEREKRISCGAFAVVRETTCKREVVVNHSRHRRSRRLGRGALQARWVRACRRKSDSGGPLAIASTRDVWRWRFKARVQTLTDRLAVTEGSFTSVDWISTKRWTDA